MADRKEVFVIRIAVSLEGLAQESTVTVEATGAPPEAPARSEPESPAPPPSPSPSPPPVLPPRFRGRDTEPTQAREGDTRGMSEAQKKALFRLAYGLGDREGALDRVLRALGVERLDWATRVQASHAIDVLRAETDRSRTPSPRNGASHA